MIKAVLILEVAWCLVLTPALFGGNTRKISREGIGHFKSFLYQQTEAIDNFLTSVLDYQERPRPFQKDLIERILSEYLIGYQKWNVALESKTGPTSESLGNTFVDFDADRYQRFVDAYAQFAKVGAAQCGLILKGYWETFLSGKVPQLDLAAKTQLLTCRKETESFKAEVASWFASKKETHVLPALTFHGGNREPLLEDIRLGNISNTVWENFILGGANDWSLPSYRRGFYVTSSTIIAAKYAERAISKKKWPWILFVQVAPDCRKVDFDSRNPRNRILTEGSPLRSWLKKNLPSAFHSEDDFVKLCGHRRLKIEGLEYSISLTDYQVEPADRRMICYDTFNEWMKFNQARVVMDNVESDSWYFRDPACVSKTYGSSEEQLMLMTERDSAFWKFEDFNEYGFDGHKLVYLQVLNEANNLSIETLDLLMSRQEEAIDRMNLVQSRSEGHVSLLEEYRWFADKTKSCLKRGGIDLFRQQLGPFLKVPRRFEDRWPKISCD